jgi:hypothetical protein
MIRTALIGTQCYKFSLAATEPGGLKHCATQSEVAAGDSRKVGSKLFKMLFMATLTATMFCTSARAAICEGPIAAVALWADGRLHVRQGTLNSPIWSICNVNNSTGYEASVVACKSWLAILMSAQKTGTTLQIYTRSTACDLADWHIADVYYLEDRG